VEKNYTPEERIAKTVMVEQILDVVALLREKTEEWDDVVNQLNHISDACDKLHATFVLK
jgi:hypothetical protein